MTDVPMPTDASVTAQVDQADQRLLWTGAAANGALILALIGFAGNASDTVAALRMITLPALISIAGFSFGGTAITHGLARLAHRLVEPIAQTKIAMAHRQMGAFKEVMTMPPMDPEFARVVWGDQAEDQMRMLLHGRLQAAQAATDQSAPLFEEAIKSLQAATDAGTARLRMAQRWLWASFVTAAIAVMVLLGQVWLTKPEAAPGPITAPGLASKASQPAGPVAPSATLPPCPSGAAACKPWERAWSKPPPIGTVVPDQVAATKK